MSRKNLIAFSLVILVFAGCKKTTDNAAKWVGTYTSSSGGGLGYNNFINQVQVEESNDFTLRLFLNNSSGTNVVTYTVLQNVVLQNATSGTISESDSTNGLHSPAAYTGSVALISGDTLKMICAGVDSTGATPISYNFYGVK
jgi:hypothetical protein